MQCPACNHESPDESFGDPAKCPACGVYYEKALALKQRRAAVEQGPAQSDETGARPSIKSGWLGAKVSVEEGRQRRAQEQAEKARRVAKNAVVVTDVQIPFGSMVTLLVKLALAAIPAAIILALIGAVVFGVIKAVQDAYDQPEPVAKYGSSSSSRNQLIPVPSDSQASYEMLDIERASTNVVLTTRRTSGTGEASYAKRFVDCRMARWRYLGTGATLSEMEANEASSSPSGFASFERGSIAFHLAKKACDGIPGTHPSLK